MERWVGRVAVVTGASSGIGAAIAVDLLNAGLIVVGLARRADRIKELASRVDPKYRNSLHAFKCDICQEADILAAFAWIDRELGGADILINNAGITVPTRILEPNNTADMKAVLDTNVLGLVLCTREAFHSMKRRSINGHVVLINSIIRHKVPNLPGTSLNMYAPSKYAVTAATEVLRQEFLAAGTQIKITSISPGIVLTDILPKSMGELVGLQPENVSSAVLFALGTPPDVQVLELTIKAMGDNVL